MFSVHLRWRRQAQEHADLNFVMLQRGRASRLFFGVWGVLRVETRRFSLVVLHATRYAQALRPFFLGTGNGTRSTRPAPSGEAA